jgi:hypothetical protein
MESHEQHRVPSRQQQTSGQNIPPMLLKNHRKKKITLDLNFLSGPLIKAVTTI